MRATAPDLDALYKGINHADREGDAVLHAFFIRHFFFEKDTQGRTFAQRWEQDGLRDLKNDERVLWRGKMQTQIALLEIHRVLENDHLEAIDLLSPHPAPMIFQDRSFVTFACRFSTILAWIYPLPHFWRLSGAALKIPDLGQFPAREIVQETVKHLGGPLEENEMRRWLVEHFEEFNQSLTATAHLRRRQMFSAMDAKWGKAVYELRAPFAQCRGRLDELAAVNPEDLAAPERDEGFAEARIWLDESQVTDKYEMSGAKPVLGRVLLGQSLWRLEAFGAKKLARLRRQFEDRLGESVRFQGERLDDLAARLAAKEPHAEESLVPPRLLENPGQIAFTSSVRQPLPGDRSPEEIEQQWIRETDKAFLGDSVPALNHRTPREAARDPALRPKLVQLMKQRVRSRDEENLRSGRSEDINWMLRELELNELIFDPPPWRPPPPESDFEDEDFDWEDARDVQDPDRMPAPPLPSQPLTFEEVCRRYQKAVEAFDTFKAAENELTASGSTLLDDADDLTLELISDDDFSVVIPLLVHTWFILVPIGCLAPELNYKAMEKAFESNLRQIEIRLRTGNAKQFESWLMSSPQPNVMLMLASTLMQSATSGSKEIRTSIDAQPIILVLLKTIVEELDAVLRSK